MMYISVSGEPIELAYTCRHCSLSESGASISSEMLGSAVLSTDYTDDQTSYKQHASPYLRFDPTLPRVSDIPCPNKACNRPESARQEVIEVKYDATHLKYLYHCVHCLSFWKSQSMYTTPS